MSGRERRREVLVGRGVVCAYLWTLKIPIRARNMIPLARVRN